MPENLGEEIRGSAAVLYRVRLPMHTRFDHPAARRAASDSLVLRLTSEGTSGVGECAPRSYVTGETSDSVLAALRRTPLERVFTLLRDEPPAELLERIRREGFGEVFRITGGNNLLCLLETAVLDLLGRRLGLGATELIAGSGPTPGRAPATPCTPDTSGTSDPAHTSGVPAVAALPVSQVLDLSITAEEFLATRGPFHFVKIKASDDIERDARSVRAVRAHVGDGVPVMVDANMSWTETTALPHAWRLRDAGADYVEEPLPKGSWAALRTLRRRAGLKIMLDESLCTPEDARTAVTTQACDAFNIRVAKNGGPLRAARIVQYARRHGIAFQIGVQVAEVGPLINASRALAFCHRDALTVEAGQSDRFFPEMIVSPRPVVDRRSNTLSPAPGPGFGMSLNSAAEPWAELVLPEENGSWQPATAPRHAAHAAR
ncbi:mandelate racemase/muconate lactonizing enzyme family protein [Streptomyces sp. NPDC127038]|uniref:mandelate racemase/muconate lactonizing enzyme family protein n=1 Tax=Streptomyces sp. NPDC127038 TaxID=3347114 RepID=UPI00365705F9